MGCRQRRHSQVVVLYSSGCTSRAALHISGRPRAASPGFGPESLNPRMRSSIDMSGSTSSEADFEGGFAQIVGRWGRQFRQRYRKSPSMRAHLVGLPQGPDKRSEGQHRRAAQAQCPSSAMCCGLASIALGGTPAHHGSEQVVKCGSSAARTALMAGWLRARRQRAHRYSAILFARTRNEDQRCGLFLTRLRSLRTTLLASKSPSSGARAVLRHLASNPSTFRANSCTGGVLTTRGLEGRSFASRAPHLAQITARLCLQAASRMLVR